MVAILSCTDNPLYSFFIPITCWSWNKIGFKTTVFINTAKGSPSFQYAISLPEATKNGYHEFHAEQKRIPTYSQVSRLFGGCLYDNNEYLITGDIDLAVFSDRFRNDNHQNINIYGEDLTGFREFPLSFIGMRANKWREIFKINNRTPQECISELIDPIEGENIRGEQWSFDQWYATKMIKESGEKYSSHLRAKSPSNQTATQRADRDGWNYNSKDILDAHWPRPGYGQDNFNKILKLLKDVYPQDNFDWLIEYRNKFVELL